MYSAMIIRVTGCRRFHDSCRRRTHSCKMKLYFDKNVISGKVCRFIISLDIMFVEDGALRARRLLCGSKCISAPFKMWLLA